MNRTDARDEIFSRVASVWTDQATSIVGSSPELRFQGVKYSTDVNVDVYWARLTLQVVTEDQETLRNGVRRFRTDGLVFVQLFNPINDPQLLPRTDALAEMTRNIFRTRTPEDNIIFTRARINDNIDPEPAWQRINVISEFEYVQFL